MGQVWKKTDAQNNLLCERTGHANQSGEDGKKSRFHDFDFS
jgi:hypothetical protein